MFCRWSHVLFWWWATGHELRRVPVLLPDGQEGEGPSLAEAIQLPSRWSGRVMRSPGVLGPVWGPDGGASNPVSSPLSLDLPSLGWTHAQERMFHRSLGMGTLCNISSEMVLGWLGSLSLGKLFFWKQNKTKKA